MIIVFDSSKLSTSKSCPPKNYIKKLLRKNKRYKINYKTKYFSLEKYNQDERYEYFIYYASEKKPSVKNKKRLIKIVKTIIEKEIFNYWNIERLINNIPENNIFQIKIYSIIIVIITNSRILKKTK